MTHLEVTWQGQRSFEVKLLLIVISVNPYFFKLLLFEQVRFNYNQTWYIGALWEPSHYDALRGHMTRSKVIGGQIVIVILVNLFQILFEQVRFNYNQTWIIYRYNKGAQWEPSRYDAFRGHMTRSKVIGGQIVIVMVALFQIAPAWTGSLRLQPNLNHRCTMGTFTLWRTSRSHDKVKCHFRSTSLKLVLIFCLRSFLLWYCYICNFLTSRVTHVFFA